MPKPIVAIVGRPNVGKSTLFNRIVGARIAIVEDMPGVTRDRLYQDAEWQGREFTLVDTGGLDFAEDIITAQIRKQAELAIYEADIILFVVDAREGLTAIDEEVGRTLRRADKPVILVANKVEHFDKIPYYDFYQLGLGDPVPVSAAEGLNTGDLLDELVKNLPAQDEDPYPPDTIRIAVIGRPNVGKSSLVNTILGEERVIVSNIPGTTRDAIDSSFEKNGKNYVLVDTAGMRRRKKIDLPTERYSVVRALRAVDRCDVALMVFDATEGIAEQDKRIVGYAHEKGKAIILIINKWDLIEKDDKTMNRFEKKIREELAFLDYVPTLYISALTKQRVPKVLETVDFVAEEASKRVATADLNNLIREATQHNPPPADKHRRLKIFYATQGGVKPPTFILFVNEPEIMHFSYQRYLENKIRDTYGFKGTPIRFFLRKREGKDI
ncbi:small GTP-binding protein [Desulforamulus reducens MI-1]|uniref:GTPase Der n=1 Tax=Desulforamulus reducens (strain ATCC BAA-1160 / DSM 100696 / MI-1) TaxID=349161 RepID=DER_DESRM|nr:ribosome biogenesis GTPase Der [Desulforamulus reducens]A4J3P1.1 RecName: Full=GTPase Der; AltName: Full=GTP-binding protein EngA [Desulforamulus reducens MI-1]ABO49694.1 small GTP-binding protein [Desulforamulus reducens MI-1]